MIIDVKIIQSIDQALPWSVKVVLAAIGIAAFTVLSPYIITALIFKIKDKKEKKKNDRNRI